MFTFDDRCDMSKRNSLCGKVNNVLVYFSKCDLLVKLKLLRIYPQGVTPQGHIARQYADAR